MSAELLVVLLLYSFGNIAYVRGCVGIILPNRLRLGSNIRTTVLSAGANCRQYLFRMYPKDKPGDTFYARNFVLNDSVGEAETVIFPPLPPRLYNESQISARLWCIEYRRDFWFVTNITIDHQPGYLFIQLDKPVYTPAQQVKYRVMAVDEDLKWAEWPVQISIYNPWGIQVYSETKTSRSAFHKSMFQLSANAQRGIWKMKAAFKNVSTKYSTTFEVRDYVLPRFKVQVSATPRGLYTERKLPLTINITAKYKTGRPVSGKMILAIFVKANDKSQKLLQIFKNQYWLRKSGKEMVVLDHDYIQKYLKHFNLKGATDLYAGVEVTESASHDVVRTKVMIATSAEYPYHMKIINKRSYFKPRVPYDFEIEVRNVDGSYAVDVKVVLVLDENITTTVNTDKYGRAIHVYKLGFRPSRHQIKFYPKLYHHLYKDVHKISRVDYPKAYITVKAMLPVRMHEDLVLKIFHKNIPKAQEYFVIVTSRGRHIYNSSFISGNGSLEHQIIPQSYLKFMVPNSRVLVYFIFDHGLISGSLFLEMPWTCLEELSVNVTGQKTSIAPGDTGQLSIRGGANMQIGLVAMDKDLYTAHYDILTREKLFTTLASHDMGSGVGEGKHQTQEFENSGLRFSSLRFTFGGSSYMYIREGKPFPDYRMERRVSPDSEYTRSFFPESWLFEEGTLGSDGKLDINLTYPDSDGTWMIYAVGVSENGGVCVSHPEEVSVVKYLNLDLVMPSRVVVSEEVELVVRVSNDLGYRTLVDILVTAEGLCRSKTEPLTFKNISIDERAEVAKAFSILTEKPGRYVISATARSNHDDAANTMEKILVVMKERTLNQNTISYSRWKNNNYQKVKRDLVHAIFSNVSPNKIIPDDFGGAESLALDVLPKCYALKYLSRGGHLSNQLMMQQRYVLYGISELMKYRNPDGAFCLEEPDKSVTSKTSTWFTALVLKSVCQTQNTTDAYRDATDESYNWLFSQINCTFMEGAVVTESEPRMIEEEQTQLMAELLTSSVECAHRLKRRLLEVETKVNKWFATEQRSRAPRFKSLLAMAKVVHVLQRLNNGRRYWKKALGRLWAHRKVLKDGSVFWFGRISEILPNRLEFDPPDSECIETTAYCLMIFIYMSAKCDSAIKRKKECVKYYVEPDSIAQWLLQWRDRRGHFVTTTDTIVATEALLLYMTYRSKKSAGLFVNNATNGPRQASRHSQQVHERNVVVASRLPGVHMLSPVGSGSDLSHINARLPLAPYRAPCEFNMGVTIYKAKHSSEPGSECGQALHRRVGGGFKCRKNDAEEDPAYGVYCLQLCIRYEGESRNVRTAVRVSMLSGFVPDKCDLQELQFGEVMRAAYSKEGRFVQVQLRPFAPRGSKCIRFRIKRVHRVLRLKPAFGAVKQAHQKEWICPKEYTGPEHHVSKHQSCDSEAESHFRECFCVNDTEYSLEDVQDRQNVRKTIDDSLQVAEHEPIESNSTAVVKSSEKHRSTGL